MRRPSPAVRCSTVDVNATSGDACVAPTTTCRRGCHPTRAAGPLTSSSQPRAPAKPPSVRRSPAVTKARVPHVALVLLPAALLAAVGVRAVTAEMRASEDAARERARSVASRLARSVDALVAEYAGALPKAGTS